MTAGQPAGRSLGRRLDARVAAASALGLGHLVAASRSGPVWARTVGSPRAGWAAAIAFAAPMTLVGPLIARRDIRWCLPPSGAGKALLVGWTLSGAITEEILWRGVLTYCAPSAARTTGAVTLAIGFVLVHPRAEGPRDTAIHLVNSAAWTASAVLGRRLRYPVLAHAAYNTVVTVLRDRRSSPVEPGQADRDDVEPTLVEGGGGLRQAEYDRGPT